MILTIADRVFWRVRTGPADQRKVVRLLQDPEVVRETKDLIGRWVWRLA